MATSHDGYDHTMIFIAQMIAIVTSATQTVDCMTLHATLQVYTRYKRLQRTLQCKV